MKPLWQQREDKADHERETHFPWVLFLAALLFILGWVLLTC